MRSPLFFVSAVLFSAGLCHLVLFMTDKQTIEKTSPNHIAAAFKDSVPVFMGYIPLGIVFGFLFVQAGGDWWLAPLASFLIYGGASQYMMVPMIAAGMSVAAIAFATFVINFRHVFYGISLLNKLPAKGWPKWYVAFTLTDETYSILCTMKEGTPLPRMLWLCFFDHCWWVVGTLIGAIAGAQAKLDLAGLDFVLTSLFAMLTCEQWRARKSAWPLWSALVSYAVARIVFPEQALAVAIGFCVAAGLLWGSKFRRNERRPQADGEFDKNSRQQEG